jgi:hypothetical protein
MAVPKYDGVLEAVHFAPNGKVDWVRVYERRGPAFSDRIVVRRKALIERIQAGRRYMVGERIPLMASSFDVSIPVRYIDNADGGALVTGDGQADRDTLQGVPVV